MLKNITLTTERKMNCTRSGQAKRPVRKLLSRRKIKSIAGLDFGILVVIEYLNLRHILD